MSLKSGWNVFTKACRTVVTFAKASFRVVAALSFTLGTAALAAGTAFLGIQKFLGYIGVDNPVISTLLEGLAIGSAFCALTLTQGVTNWKLFIRNGGSSKDAGFIKSFRVELAKLRFPFKISAVMIVVVGAPAAFGSAGLLGYYAGNTLCRHFGLANQAALTLSSASIGLMSSVSSVYFGLRIGVKNLSWAMQKLSGLLPSEPIVWKKAIPTFIIGSIRMACQLAVANLGAKGALSLIPGVRQLPDGIREPIAAAITTVGVGACSSNRAIQLYLRPSSVALAEQGDSASSKPQRALKGFYYLSGYSNLGFQLLMTYMSLIDAEKQMGGNPGPLYMIVANIGVSICGMVLDESVLRRAWLELLPTRQNSAAPLLLPVATPAISVAIDHGAPGRFFPAAFFVPRISNEGQKTESSNSTATRFCL